MTTQKRIVFYCQHLSGAGHFVRSREIVRELACRHPVHFVVGGRPVPGPALDESVRLVQLPAIYRTPQGLTPVDVGPAIEDVFTDRKRVLDQVILDIRPDVFVIEHFPLSKWDLRSELLSAIKTARSVNPHVQIVSSVRDHPAGSELACWPARIRSQVIAILNENFTALLVHSDPRVVRLESQFSWVSGIEIPIHYTGYVSQRVEHLQPCCPSTSQALANGYVLVSSGGLGDGERLATLSSSAWQLLHDRGATAGRCMVILAGLHVGEAQYDTLERTLRGGPFLLLRFSDEFLRWMQAADLSISQGGYNTTMNVLATRTRAILAPNRRMPDQQCRARLLEERNLVDVIDAETISVDQLADRILQALSRRRPEHTFALDGAERTCDIIEALSAFSNDRITTPC
jgi:predicted glycosyltransferase